MPVSERTIQAVVESNNQPRHGLPDGTLGDEIEIEEWIESQVRVACKAMLGMIRPPRFLDDNAEGALPRITEQNEETAFRWKCIAGECTKL